MAALALELCCMHVPIIVARFAVLMARVAPHLEFENNHQTVCYTKGWIAVS